MTDSDREILEQHGISPPSPGGLSEEDKKILEAHGVPAPQGSGVLKSIGSAVNRGLETADTYLGSPRTALADLLHQYKMANGNLSLSDAPSLAGHAIGATVDQMRSGQLPPSGKDIATEAGLSTKPLSEYGNNNVPFLNIPIVNKGSMLDVSPAGVAGAGIDFGANALNLIPFGAMARGAGRVGEALSGPASTAFRKTANFLTGTPEKAIGTYMESAPEVRGLIASSEGSSQAAADATRAAINSKLAKFKKSQNETISNALGSASPERAIDVNPVFESVQDALGAVGQEKPEQINQMTDLLSRMDKIVPPDPMTGSRAANLSEVTRLKSLLQDYANYDQSRLGFQLGRETELAAKRAGALARESAVGNAPQEYIDAYKNLETMHDIEGGLLKGNNLLSEGAPGGSISEAASSPRNKEAINQLSNLIGEDLSKHTDVLQASKYFGDYPLGPVETTGKSFMRAAPMIAAGTAVGQTIGGHTGGIIGGSLGAMMSSPTALKYAIDAGRIAPSLVRGLVGLADNAPLSMEALKMATIIAQSPSGRAFLNGSLGAPQVSSHEIFRFKGQAPALDEKVKRNVQSEGYSPDSGYQSEKEAQENFSNSQ